MEKYIMAIDQGTTSSRAIIFDHNGKIVNSAQKEFTQIFKHPGWVEHDANEIWMSVLSCMAECLITSKITPEQISGIGITNQRETTIIWDKKTGLPVYNALVWQSRQSDYICEQLKKDGYTELIKSKTGLVIDPYFSASKIRWILDHIENGQSRAENGELSFGTIDSYLVYKLSGGKVHITDYTNASRTMIYNIHELKWDEEILEILNIPDIMLPEVKNCSEIYANTDPVLFFGANTPICGIAGDQQASLFGQGCYEEGMAKNTYGTGCFMLLNTGKKAIESKNGLVTTIAIGLNDEIQYALEGSIFVAGSAIQWLRDELHFFKHASESYELAVSLSSNEGVYIVPSFVGLGAPYWKEKCRGAIFGLTRGTSIAHITRATLESLCYQSKDVLDAMENDANIKLKSLKVDGGAIANNFLMQFQSDIINLKITRNKMLETTALGAAMLAGLAVGYWNNPEEVIRKIEIDKEFIPSIKDDERNKYLSEWHNAIESVIGYSKNHF